MKLKVCGLTMPQQVHALDEIGVDYLGFIFYAGSSRYVYNQLDAPEIKKLQLKKAKKVGVFVNESVAKILETVDSCGLDAVQLHGDESPVFCAQMAEHLPTIKAIRLKGNADIERKINPYKYAADMLLFDTGGAGYGGTGEKFNWNLLKEASINIPFFLSGGIDPDDVDDIQTFAEEHYSNKLFGIDINSKFETAPGMKHIDSIRSFLTGISTGIKRN